MEKFVFQKFDQSTDNVIYKYVAAQDPTGDLLHVKQT